MKKIFVLTSFFFIISSAPSWAETYEGWVSKCRSYKDVADWLNQNFVYDRDGNEKGSPPGQNSQKLKKVRDSKETFRSKTGLSLEVALFVKHTLNRINPDYRAEIIHLTSEKFPVHYVCGFYLGGKLFIMDYGTPYENMIGTNGPFENLDQYVQRFYSKYHPLHRKLASYNFGLPPRDSTGRR